MKSNTIWLVLLIVTNLFFIFTLWLAAPGTFRNVASMMALFTFFICVLGYWIYARKQKKQLAAWENVLSNPEEDAEKRLLEVMDESWHAIILTVLEQRREQDFIIKDKQLEIQNYEEFIEAWTHEIKTPLALSTLVLDNHKDEMSPYVYRRMEHIRHVINDNVEKILYYARLHAGHMDYKFERVDLRECVLECLDDFYPIAEEKEILLQLELLPLPIVSDKKVLIFIIGQILSNGFKYTKPQNGIVDIKMFVDEWEDKKIHLVIRDNGNGVLPEDLPFLFDKGFTGNYPERKNATGMGLYLTKKYAEDLSIKIRVDASSTSGDGFEIELIFPQV